MIGRYTRPEMGALWSDRHRVDSWLRVEIAVCEAWADAGVVPADALPALRAATCDLDRMDVIERETQHDMIAFLRATTETVPAAAARFLHLGLTSTDVVDTALALQLTDATDLLLRGIDSMLTVLADLATRHRHTVMIGRTHGIHAEPITFGLKVAVWYDDMRRQRARLIDARGEVSVGKLAGAVGSHATMPPTVEENACQRLGLSAAAASTQVVGRDRHARFVTTLALIAASLENIATELRHLQRTEVREAEEPFSAGQQGSSAMPHKRNPILAERVCGLARVLRGYAITALEDVTLWHERDISHSSAERIILPDACIGLDYMLALMERILGGLRVDAARMAANTQITAGLIASSRLLLALVDEGGLPRQEAYKLVQGHAMQAWLAGTDFAAAMRADSTVQAHLTPAQLDVAFDLSHYLQHIDATYQRVGLSPT